MTTARKTTEAKTPVRKAATKRASPTTRQAVAARVSAPEPKKVSTPLAPSPKVAKPAKPKKAKLVRDSFTIPKAEYSVLADLKLRALKAGVPAKKSELLRAGIKALAAMSEVAFLASLGAVPAIKTGRPAND